MTVISVSACPITLLLLFSRRHVQLFATPWTVAHQGPLSRGFPRQEYYQLASIRQMTRQVSRGSAGDYQADEQAGVAGLRWRVSGR